MDYNNLINFSNIEIKEITENNYKLFFTENEKKKNIIIDFKNIIFPFGIEKHFNVYYLNVEINNIELINYIKLFENNIQSLIKTNIKYSDYSFISNIKERNKYLPLLKTRITNKYNKFICKTKYNLFELETKTTLYNIKVHVDLLWFKSSNKTFGLLWTLTCIE